MYGSKHLSSGFATDDLVKYLLDDYAFDPLPPSQELVVRNSPEVKSVLEDPIRQRYLGDGSLSLCGGSVDSR
jgi:hypothetical protein